MRRDAAIRSERPPITPQTVRRMAVLTDDIADALDAALAATIAPHARDPHLQAAIVGGIAAAITRLEKDGMAAIGDSVVRLHRPPRLKGH